MKIIINQDKELRAVGYEEKIGCNPLETEFYIAKILKPQKPIHCIIDNRFHLLMYQYDKNENYLIYKPFNILNLKYDEGIKSLRLSFDNEETSVIELKFLSLNINSLEKFKRGV